MADEIVPHGGTIDSQKEVVKTEQGLHKRWMMAIDLASGEEEQWRKNARTTLARYRDESPDTNLPYKGRAGRFNILWSNVEILRPALYSQTPQPDVRRRYRDPNPMGRSAAELMERALSYCLDAYDADHAMELAVLDYVLPGRAVVRVRYKPYLENEGEEDENKSYESAEWEYWPWERFRRGPGGIWQEVPWVAYEHLLSKDEIERRFGKEVADEIELDVEVSAEKQENRKDNASASSDIFRRGRIWEVWDKETSRVLWVAPTLDTGPIKVEDDPMQLEGFFDTPRPMYSVESTNTLVPVEEYRLYKDQADELDRVTRRIQKLVDALKWRGIYDSTLKEMSVLMKADDNDLIPAGGGITTLAQTGGLDKHIWMMPIESAARVLVSLYEQREQVKQTIYEIIGLSDILRGASNPNETLGAQQIKASSGSMRLDRRRREVQRYVRDLLRIKAEIIAQNFAPETLAVMTGTPLAEVAQLLPLLRDDGQRGFAIDVETDSTVAADVQSDQAAMSELLTGIASYFQAVGPAVAAGYFPVEAAKALLMAAVRRFKLGRQVEVAIEDASNPQAEQPQQQQAQPDPVEMMKLQVQSQKDQAVLQLEAQKAQADAQFKSQEISLKDRDQKLREAGEVHRQFMDKVDRQMNYAQMQDGVVARGEAREDSHVLNEAGRIDQFMAEQEQDMSELSNAIGQLAQVMATSQGQVVARGRMQPINSFVDEQEEEMKELSNAIMQLAEIMAQQAQAQAQRDEMMMAALTAPKEIVRDGQGRVMGSRVAMQ